MFTRLLFITTVLFVQPGVVAFSFNSTGGVASPSSIFDSFYAEEALNVTLTTDLDALINDRRRKDYLEATLSYKDRTGARVNWNLKVKPRGKYRRRICDFPPVKLKFSQEELAAAGLNGHNDLKLVTHCLDERDEGLDNLFREYLAYKMYNVLTPDSYRVQLVRIQYRDSEGKVSAIKRYGFILEDTDEMAERLGGVECDTCMNPTPGTMIQEKENLLSVFQYMIGNSDWSYRMARNLKFVEKSSGQWLPVPFDFDFSGLVNADYALPNADYGQRDVQNRIFMGLEPDPSILFQTLDLFRTRKGALYAEVKRLKKLTPEARQDIDAYLDQFFFTLENNSKEQLLVTFTPAEWNIPITPGTDDGDSSGGVR